LRATRGGAYHVPAMDPRSSSDLNTPVLRFTQVSKSFQDPAGAARRVLSQVSCDVTAGRKVAVIGRSGSGKSTFLHLAAGIEVPTSGAVLLDGRDLAVLSERERTLTRRNQVGLVFQFFHLLPHLTVRENVALPEWIAGTPSRDFMARIDHLLARVSLADRADDLVQKLSGGEMQRVAICRALLRRPRLLLADEPTGNLDDAGSRVVMDLLLQMLQEEKGTLIFATHSQDLAALADETWRIHDGILERL
jgi:putative ABC transport system ATP-binding protein